MVFLVEQSVLKNTSSQRAWKVLVLNGRWVYERPEEAMQVLHSSEADHDDEIQCRYRVREVSAQEALKLAQELELPNPSTQKAARR